MLRAKLRLIAVAALVLCLQLLATVPASQARPLTAPLASATHPAPAAHGAAGWLAAALARLTRVLTGADAVQPLTGSCIDPQGRPNCPH